jgi:1-acyl-sn-glycerol-3-phosphate acyltransferase
MEFPDVFPHIFELSQDDEEKIDEIFSHLRVRYKNYSDPWGFNLELCEKVIKKLMPIYRNYFRVRVFGGEKLEDHPYIVVSNHTGQLPIDAMLMTIAFVIDVKNPRILRAMIERFMAQLPFLGDLTAQTGSILGDRANCQYLLDNGESILVFPEGARGISKNTKDFYKLQSFPQGFFRIALQKHTDVLPCAVIGAEEMFPFVFQAKSIAKLLALPSLPISANLLPLPSPIDIYIGDAYSVPKELSADAPDKDLQEHIFQIENQIKTMIMTGLENRRSFLLKKKATK